MRHPITSSVSCCDLHDCIRFGKSSVYLEHIIRTNPESVFRGERGRTPAHTILESVRDPDEVCELLQLLLAHDSEAMSRADIHGEWPLHTAIRWSVHCDVLDFVWNAFPEATTQVPCCAAVRPLLQAIQCDNLSAVQWILNRSPQCLMHQDTKNHTSQHPLHMAIEMVGGENAGGPRSTTILRLLLDAYSESTDCDSFNSWGKQFPIHLACQKRCDVHIFQMLLDANPDAVNLHADVDKHEGDFICCDGYLPLHHAIASECSTEVVLLLIERAPATLLMFSSISSDDIPVQPPSIPLLPVHVAAIMRPTETSDNDINDLLSVLVTRCPNSLSVPMKDGGTALHYTIRHACNGGFGLHAMRTVYWNCQTAAHVADNNGWLPIHVAAAEAGEFIASDAIKLLAENHPETLTKADTLGRLPLHILVSEATRVPCSGRHLLGTAGRRMIELNLKALQQADKKGRLPLHWACYSNQHVSIVQCLVDSFPQSVNIQCDGKLPLFIACESGSLDLVFLLLRRSPEITFFEV